MATKKRKTNPGIDTIRQRKVNQKKALNPHTKKKAAPKKVSGKSQTNKSIKKGKDKLRAMSKAQIEKLRAQLRAKAKAKKAKKK